MYNYITVTRKDANDFRTSDSKFPQEAIYVINTIVEMLNGDLATRLMNMSILVALVMAVSWMKNGKKHGPENTQYKRWMFLTVAVTIFVVRASYIKLQTGVMINFTTIGVFAFITVMAFLVTVVKPSDLYKVADGPYHYDAGSIPAGETIPNSQSRIAFYSTASKEDVVMVVYSVAGRGYSREIVRHVIAATTMSRPIVTGKVAA
jgi:hypothetical protein